MTHATSVLDHSRSLVPSMQQLRDLAVLKANWDGEGAEPLSQRAVADAALLAVEIEEQFRISPCFVSPIPDGGVQIEWEGSARRLEVIIAPDGELAALLIDTTKTHKRDIIDMHDVSRAAVFELVNKLSNNESDQWK